MMTQWIDDLEVGKKKRDFDMKTRILIEMVLNSDFTHVCVRVN